MSLPVLLEHSAQLVPSLPLQLACASLGLTYTSTGLLTAHACSQTGPLTWCTLHNERCHFSVPMALHVPSIQLIRCMQGLTMSVADQTASAPPADFMSDSLATSLAQHTLSLVYTSFSCDWLIVSIHCLPPGKVHAGDCCLSDRAGPRTAMPRWHQLGGWCRCSSSMLSLSLCLSLSRQQT